MHKINLIFTLLLISVGLSAQFVNNGATVTIQSGATLRVETDIQNNGTGTITNNGTIEVSGNFTNAGTAVMTPAVGLVKFISVTGSPANVTLNTGGDVLNNVEMAKTSSNTVTLAAPASIGGNLIFTGAGSKVLLGANDLTMTNAAGTVTATTNHPTNGYVVTDGTGKFVKALSGSATVAHQIGDATNYTPVSNVVTGSGAGTLGARVYTTALQSKYSDATDYINREWNVVAAGIGSYTNTMTGTYVAGDAIGSTSLIKGCTYHTGDWQFAGSGSGTNQVIASTTNIDVKLSGQNFYGKANLKAYLAGALPSGTTMTTTLRTNNLIPLASPYSAAPFNAPAVTATSIPANATDWILVEVRDASTPATVVSQTSAFILNDGTIVNMDGQPLRLKNAVSSGHIALKHRNHLGIRTASALDLVNPPGLKDFSLGTSEAYTDEIAVANNPNMKLVGSLYALWAGNANNDDRIRYSGSGTDVNAISSAVLSNPLNTTFSSTFPLVAYHPADVNMNGEVKQDNKD